MTDYPQCDLFGDPVPAQPGPALVSDTEPVVAGPEVLPPTAAPLPAEEVAGQAALFSDDEVVAWRKHWHDMPAFEQDNAEPASTINVQFRSLEDRRAFLQLLGEQPNRLKSIWYPRMEYLKQSDQQAAAVTVEANAYPIYIISKGRWEKRLTMSALDKLGIAYRAVVEPQEQEQYAAVIDPAKILVLPFSNLGQGSIPARNWVWEHAASQGVARHWILDDNIDGFYRLHENLKRKVVDCNPFLPVEEFADRYSNVALAGMQYEFFANRRAEWPAFVLNTRIYSCILIQNSIPYRWRGRYNEDTDLSLRALKDGWCTVLFYAFLAKKMPTMTMKGGNTDELYQEDGRRLMAESLQAQHPEHVTIVRKWGRWQHNVDYTPFRRNTLVSRNSAKGEAAA